MNGRAETAGNLELFRQAVAAHDRESLTHPAHGIGISAADMLRLGFADGEELWPGVCVYADRGRDGRFRVLCLARHAGADATEMWDGPLR